MMSCFQEMALIKLTSGISVDVFSSHFTTKDILQEKVSVTGSSDKEDPFYIVNLGKLIHLHKHVSDLANNIHTSLFIVKFLCSGMI